MSEIRYTDNTPPRATVKNIANWVHAHGEEARPGQDETTIKPQSRQNRIDTETSYTACDIWFAGGIETLGLLHLSTGRVTGLDVYDGERFWRIHRNGKTGVWWIDSHFNPAGVQLSDVSRFPLKYCTRLPYERNRPIKGIINADGASAEWIIEEY